MHEGPRNRFLLANARLRHMAPVRDTRGFARLREAPCQLLHVIHHASFARSNTAAPPPGPAAFDQAHIRETCTTDEVGLGTTCGRRVRRTKWDRKEATSERIYITSIVVTRKTNATRPRKRRTKLRAPHMPFDRNDWPKDADGESR